MEGRSDVDPGDGTLDFFRSVADDVHRYISRLTGGDVHLTEDIVQETFIAVFRHRRAFPDVQVGKGWVMITARNRLIDHVRSNQRDRARAERHEVGEPLDAEPPDCGWVSSEQARWLLRCLPEQERMALALHTVDGLTIAEVAVLLERSTEATMSLVARARRRLRTIVMEHQDA
jgi:RNA polymerase sigma-70 factor, ECF subfamily